MGQDTSDQWMRGRAWLKIDAAATQLPIAKARRLRAFAPTDLARLGFGGCRYRGLIRDSRFSGSSLLGLIFGIRHHRRKFARKRGDIRINSLRVDTGLSIPIS